MQSWGSANNTEQGMNDVVVLNCSRTGDLSGSTWHVLCWDLCLLHSISSLRITVDEIRMVMAEQEKEI
jgi:hypothetical protein